MAPTEDRKSKKRKWAAAQSAAFVDLPTSEQPDEEVTKTLSDSPSSKKPKTKEKQDQRLKEDTKAKKPRAGRPDAPSSSDSESKISPPELGTTGSAKKAGDGLRPRAAATAEKEADQDEEAVARREKALARRKERRSKMKLKEKEKKREKKLELEQAQPRLPLTSRTGPAKPRFILFIGNLPYTATTASIKAHFSKLAPFNVRHSTNKDTGHSRGFAFLEFDLYDRMQTCLKLYHHSLFEEVEEPGTDGEKKTPVGEDKNQESEERETQKEKEKEKGASEKKARPRRINVELTAGGGGAKSAARKEKIKGKNSKLAEERARIHEKRKDGDDGGAGGAGRVSGVGKVVETGTGKERGKTEGSGRKGGGEGSDKRSRNGHNAGKEGGYDGVNGDVHPSRHKLLKTR